MRLLAWCAALAAVGFLGVGLAIDLTGSAPDPEDLRDEVELTSLVADLRSTVGEVVEPRGMSIWVPSVPEGGRS